MNYGGNDMEEMISGTMGQGTTHVDHRREARRLRRLMGFVLFAIISGHFALTLQKGASIFLNTQAYISLSVNRPFQLRWLMAPVLKMTIAGLSDVKPQQIVSHLPSYVQSTDAIAYLLINAISFLIALTGMSDLSNSVFAENRAARRIAMLIFIATAYYLFCLNPNLAYILPYDIPALAFCSVSLALAVREKWLPLFLIFPIAVMNRESILFLPIFLTVSSVWRKWDRAGILCAGGLILIWAIIYTGEAYILLHTLTQQGSRVLPNFHTLLKPWQWPSILALPAMIVVCGRAALRPSEVTPWQISSVLCWLILFYFAQITETRAFGDLIPFIAIALAPVVATWLGLATDGESQRAATQS